MNNKAKNIFIGGEKIIDIDSILIFFLLLFSVISGKTVKSLTSYSGMWINPQYAIALVLLLKWNTEKKIRFKKENNCLNILVFTIVIFYWLSAFLIFQKINYEKALSGALKVSLDILLLFIPLINLKKHKIKTFYNIFLVLGYVEIFLLLYGLLSFYSLIPDIGFFKLDFSNILSYYQFGSFFFTIPKWGGTFPETQALSLFFFFIVILVSYYEKINDSKRIKTKLIFIFFTLFTFSKSVIVALILYFIMQKNIKKLKFLKLFYFAFGILFAAYILFKLLGSYEGLTSINNEGTLGERVFHIKNSLYYMQFNIKNILFGLGPRQYGTYLNEEYTKYGLDTNLMSTLNVLSEIGIFGFIVFLIFLTLGYLVIKKNNKRNAFYYFLICLGNFTNPDPLSSIFWIYLGLIIYINSIYKEGIINENSN